MDYSRHRYYNRSMSKLGYIGANSGLPSNFIKDFYYGKGKPRKLTFDEIKQLDTLQDTGKNNVEKHLVNHLNGKLRDKTNDVRALVQGLEEGETKHFKSQWDTAEQSSYYYGIFEDKLTTLSLGSFQVKSYIEGTATKNKGAVYFRGKVRNVMNDIYDFDDDLITQNEYEAQQKEIGQPYKVSAEWYDRFTGAADIYSDGTIGNTVLKAFTLDEDNQ